MTSAKLYTYISVGSRDLFIGEAHTALGIFPLFFPCMLPTPLCGISFIYYPPSLMFLKTVFSHISPCPAPCPNTPLKLILIIYHLDCNDTETKGKARVITIYCQKFHIPKIQQISFMKYHRSVPFFSLSHPGIQI